MGVSGDGLDRGGGARASRAKSDRSLLIRLLAGAGIAHPEQQADRLLDHHSSLSNIFSASRESLDRVGGAGPRRIIMAARELLARVAREEIEDRPLLGSAGRVTRYLRVTLGHEASERAHVLFLDSANRLISDERVATGTADRVTIFPKEIVRRALEIGSTALILTHNHPGGDLAPSEEDLRVTRQLADLCRMFDIRLLDHIIIARAGHTSLRALRRI